MEQLAARVSQVLQIDGRGIVEPFQAAALPGAAPHAPSRKTVKALLGLLRSYPGGLTEPIILTHMASLPSLKQDQCTRANAASHAGRTLKTGDSLHSSRANAPAAVMRGASAAVQPAASGAAADFASESRSGAFLPLSKLIQANDVPGVGGARVATDLEGPPATRTAAGATACVSARVVRMECVSHGESGKTLCGRVGSSSGVAGSDTIDGAVDIGEMQQQQQQQQQKEGGGGSSHIHPLRRKEQQQSQPNSNGHSGSCGSTGSGDSVKGSGGRDSGTGIMPAHVATAGSRCAWLAHLQDGSLGAEEATLGLYLHSGAQAQLLASTVPAQARKGKACTEGKGRGAAGQRGSAGAGVAAAGAGAPAGEAGAGEWSGAGGQAARVPWLEGKWVRATGLVLPKAACKAHSGARNSSAYSLRQGSTGSGMQSSNDSHTNGNAGRDTRDGGGNGGGLGGKEAGGLSAVRKAVPTKWLVVMEEGSAQDCTVGTAAAAAADDDDDDNGSRGGLCSLPMQQGDLGVWDLGQVGDAVRTAYGMHHLEELVPVPGWVRAQLIGVEGAPASWMMGSTSSQAPTQAHVPIAPDSSVLLHLVSAEEAQPMTVQQQQQQQQQQGSRHDPQCVLQIKYQLPLLLQGEQVQLARLLQVGEQVTLYRPLLQMGPSLGGAQTFQEVIGLRLGPEPLIVVRANRPTHHLQQQLQQQELQQAVGVGLNGGQPCLQHHDLHHLQQQDHHQQHHQPQRLQQDHWQQQQQQQHHHLLQASLNTGVVWGRRISAVGPCRFDALSRTWRVRLRLELWGPSGRVGGEGGGRGAAGTEDGGAAMLQMELRGASGGAAGGGERGAAGTVDGRAAAAAEAQQHEQGQQMQLHPLPQPPLLLQQQGEDLEGSVSAAQHGEVDVELLMGEGSVKVIRQQLHVGYDLLLIMGKEQQRQQLQATPERACVIWDEHASGAQLQSLAMLPALLTTPCLYAPLKVPLHSLVRMCLPRAEPTNEKGAREQGDGQQQQPQVQEQQKLALQQQAQPRQQQQDLDQCTVPQQQLGKQGSALKRIKPERARLAEPGTELERASQHSKRLKPNPQDLPLTWGQESLLPDSGRKSVGPFVSSVRLEDLQVDTQRVHRVCGRPVVHQDLGDLLAMMMDSQEPSQSQGRQAPSQGRPPHSPGSMQSQQEQGQARQQNDQAQGTLQHQQQQQEQQQQQQQQHLHLQQESDSHEGLWHCEFCGLECAGSEVEWELLGCACLVDPGPAACRSTCKLKHVPLSAQALHAVLGGASAAAWRAMSGVEKQQRLSAVSGGGRHRAGHLCGGSKEEGSEEEGSIGKGSEEKGQEEPCVCGGADALQGGAQASISKALCCGMGALQQEGRLMLACVCLLPNREGRASDTARDGSSLTGGEEGREGKGGTAVPASKGGLAEGGGVEGHGGDAAGGVYLQRLQLQQPGGMDHEQHRLVIAADGSKRFVVSALQLL